MEDENLQRIIETFDWLNPKSRLKTKLGEHIGNGKFVNSTYSNLDLELALLDNPIGGKLIGNGVDGEAYLHNVGRTQRVVKNYRHLGVYKGITNGNGISQFRCLRKIKQLGFETPNVYAASEKTLVMDYVPHENLQIYVNKLDANEGAFVRKSWMDFITNIWNLIYSERIDSALVNGYIKHNIHSYDFGVIDQG